MRTSDVVWGVTDDDELVRVKIQLELVSDSFCSQSREVAAVMRLIAKRAG
jgi:hypothetical protein